MKEFKNVLQTIDPGPVLIIANASAAEIYFAVNDVNKDQCYK